MHGDQDHTPLSLWSPLAARAFRYVWIAATLSLAVVWMNDVGAAWAMKSLTSADPLMVALIQVATSVPVVFLVVPAGTLGDLLNRRHFLSWGVLVMLVSSIVLALGSAQGWLNPQLLLAVTLIGGAGKAILLPGFAAAGAELVSRDAMHAAVGLHSMANNVARIVGPALAGAIIALLSVSHLFVGTAATLCVALAALAAAPGKSFRNPDVSGDGYMAALTQGVRYCRQDPTFRGVFRRTVVFFFCAIAVHSLLPLLARDSRWLGFGWAAYGAGAIAGATLFGRTLRQRSPDNICTLGIALHALALLALGTQAGNVLRTATLGVAGFAWYHVVAAAQLSIQRAVPDALRSRGMAVFTMFMTAAFVAGAVTCGALARYFGIDWTFWSLAAISLVVLVLTRESSMRGKAENSFH